MTILPIEILLGISFGLLSGIVPAAVVATGSFTLRYYRDDGLSQFLAVALAVPIAALNASAVGVIALEPAHAPRLLVGSLVVIVLALYANSQGESLASTVSGPHSLPVYRERTLSAEALESIDGTGHVTIESTGDVRDVEGYPSLTPELRRTLEGATWRLPADLPLAELERRLEARLRTTYALATVAISIDGRGRATIAAAPPSEAVAGRVPDGWRAVSLTAAAPTGMAAGDEVTVETEARSIVGTVLAVSADGGRSGAGTGGDPDPDRRETGLEDRASVVGDSTGANANASSNSGSNSNSTVTATGPTAGGRGRVTVAVPTADAGSLLESDRNRLVVTSRETSPEFDALSLLERAGTSVRRVLLGSRTDSIVDEAVASNDDDLRVLAERSSNDESDTDANAGNRPRCDHRGWTIDPDDSPLDPSLEREPREAFVAGDVATLNRLGGGETAVTAGDVEGGIGTEVRR